MDSTRNKEKHLGLRIDPQTHAKLFFIARYEGRTGNAQILYLIQNCIKAFEREHGAIELESRE